jgi:hypothetical protein
VAARAVRILSNGASPCGVRPGTPRSSGFRRPCIWAFLNSLRRRLFKQPVDFLLDTRQPLPLIVQNNYEFMEPRGRAQYSFSGEVLKPLCLVWVRQPFRLLNPAFANCSNRLWKGLPVGLHPGFWLRVEIGVNGETSTCSLA